MIYDYAIVCNFLVIAYKANYLAVGSAAIFFDRNVAATEGKDRSSQYSQGTLRYQDAVSIILIQFQSRFALWRRSGEISDHDTADDALQLRFEVIQAAAMDLYSVCVVPEAAT